MASAQRPTFLKLTFAASTPPFLSYCWAALLNDSGVCKVATSFDDKLKEGEVGLEGGRGSGSQKLTSSDLVIARRLAELCVGVEEQEEVEIDAWTKRAADTQEAFAEVINQHLMFRAFIVGHRLTLADVAVWTSLGKKYQWTLPQQIVSRFPHLTRWYRHISATPVGVAAEELRIGRLEGLVRGGKAQQQQANGTDAGKKKQQAGSSGQYEGKLPGAVMGQVVTRFPPEPSGYLHIGHAKAALLNQFYAKHYNGKLLIRFDDTNPTKENVEFEDSIKEDLELLDIPSNVCTHTSDYFDVIRDYMTQLIKDGKAYVDDTPIEQMRQERGEGVESRCRNLSVQENLKKWEEMQKGTEIGQTYCVRAKMDMQSKNKCMRDPTFYRCNVDTPHHITGSKFKVYPLYDFACPIVDSIEGVTHAMRTNEYADRIPQYAWVQEALGLRKVTIYEYSRLNFVNTVLSKRRLQWIVDSGVVEGWEDPRFPTVRGIRRRGLTVEALLEFVLQQGPSKNANLMEWDKLWTINKQIIDPVVPRYAAVGADSVALVLSDGPSSPVVETRDLHPKNAEVGKAPLIKSRTIRLEREDAEACEDGEEITLMRWGNAVVDRRVEEDGKLVLLEGHLHLEGDVKKTKKKLHWLPALNTEEAARTPGVDWELTPCLLREYDVLITKKKPEDDDDIADIVNRNSVFDTEALGDPKLRELKQGDMLQLERRGYFRVDRAFDKQGDMTMVLIKIPDGKTKAMSTVSTKVDAAKLTRGG